MNSMKKHDGAPMGLFAKLVCCMGNMFASVATVEPRNCFGFAIYELEFPSEMKEEMHIK